MTVSANPGKQYVFIIILISVDSPSTLEILETDHVIANILPLSPPKVFGVDTAVLIYRRMAIIVKSE